MSYLINEKQLYFGCQIFYQIYDMQSKLDNNLAYCHGKLIIKCW